ncbi:MAG: hypothetical protein ACFFBP_01720 [Promethearchaeota archaeon]
MSLEIKIYTKLNCPFYECCSLPKFNNFCNHFSRAQICPEYQMKKEKLNIWKEE